ncbi:MAG TPA: single-stranded DNA-binding protein [Verrucomicrobiae bacterium]|nr:single-stranded DNA-binding protein [Verrucomicrobiae bacterium]
MNQLVISGNLAAAVHVGRPTPSGKPSVFGRVGMNDQLPNGEKGPTIWVSFTAFGQAAEVLRTLRIGQLVKLAGKLEPARVYVTHDGEPRADVRMIVFAAERVILAAAA